ncbi:MAG: hypothetical protein CMI96_04415 [Pelagibacteraceae bacterium]|nr:hypothetical protein [Pelagibacteraceae bacterium]
MFIKICGIKDKKIIQCCEKNQIDFFGLIFYNKSPRNINKEDALKLLSFANKLNIKPVGVFVNENINNLIRTLKLLNLKYVQLHGNEDQDYITLLKQNLEINIIKAISIENKIDLKKIDNYENVDYFLFDYKPKYKEMPGGNAKKFDWSILQNLSINKPWFLSGGINASNIKEIKKFSIPNGIDISSGVEDKPGIKNEEKINNLIKML